MGHGDYGDSGVLLQFRSQSTEQVAVLVVEENDHVWPRILGGGVDEELFKLVTSYCSDEFVDKF